MMRRILFTFMLVLGLFVFPVGSMAFVNGDGQTFKVKVTTSFGTQFDDCYNFNSSGVLDIALLPDPQIWAYKGLGTSHFRWQSTADGGSEFGIAFSGIKSFWGLHGDGVNENGSTFKLKGIRDKNCELFATADAAAAGNPYIQ